MTEQGRIPVACIPSAITPEQRARARELRGQLAAATEETAERPDGYSFRYRDDDAIFQVAAEWISIERRCCPFLTFELSWGRGSSSPVLHLSGPEGTKELLHEEMPELPSS